MQQWLRYRGKRIVTRTGQVYSSERASAWLSVLPIPFEIMLWLVLNQHSASNETRQPR
jgi:hypothetical protein